MAGNKLKSLRRKASTEQRFDALVRPHFDALHASARRLTLSAPDAEDLLQEVFIKALERLDELERIRYQKAWLLKVLYNLFVDLKRSGKRSAVGNAETGEDSAEADAVADLDWEPDVQAERDIRMQRILKAMSLLDKGHCALVAMHDVDGMTIAELSEITGLPEGTVKSQLYRTRAKLGRLLSSDKDLRPRLTAVGNKS